SVTSEIFMNFLWKYVIPLTNPYPDPQSVLILNNCNIHHAEEVYALVEDEALCKLMFLPPYLPDLNPIEPAFYAIKAYICHHSDNYMLGIIDEAC
ncbi:tc1-mariner class transposase, partial [Moniliophthora roreri MCA 2997]